MMMENFEKVINPLKLVRYDKKKFNVFLKIKFIDGKLSISGVEGPFSNGNCAGACGQIIMSYKERPQDYLMADPYTGETVKKIMEIWDEWHLNDMNAGTVAQTAVLKGFKEAVKKATGKEPRMDYDKQCAVLDAAGMLEDDGYKYGTAWLKRDVPEDVLDFLKSLPETDLEPAWV